MKKTAVFLFAFVLAGVALLRSQSTPNSNLAAPTPIGAFDGALYQVLNVSTAGNLTQALNLRSLLTEKGPRWSVVSTPAAGSQASAVKSAGAAGVRHVIDCVTFSAIATGAVTAANGSVQVLDGSTTLATWLTAFPTAGAAGIQEVQPHSFCGLALAGSGATSMTIQFAAGVANAQQTVTISGYDVQ